MQIKMIVTDLDRTLLNNKKQISHYTADILNRCQKNGIKVAFATARPVRATKKFQTEFIPDYVIADNGAVIACGDCVIYNRFIPSDIRDELMKVFLDEKEVKYITMEIGNCVYTNYNGPPWEDGWNIVFHDFLTAIDEDATKLSVECRNIEFLRKTMLKYPSLHLYANSGEDWCQIMCRESSKMNAITYVSELLGYRLNEVAAFGDDYNDVEMLKCCGAGVAVANAVDEAKEAAIYICDSYTQDGVAKWIDKYLLCSGQAGIFCRI